MRRASLTIKWRPKADHTSGARPSEGARQASNLPSQASSGLSGPVAPCQLERIAHVSCTPSDHASRPLPRRVRHPQCACADDGSLTRRGRTTFMSATARSSPSAPSARAAASAARGFDAKVGRHCFNARGRTVLRRASSAAGRQCRQEGCCGAPSRRDDIQQKQVALRPRAEQGRAWPPARQRSRLCVCGWKASKSSVGSTPPAGRRLRSIVCRCRRNCGRDDHHSDAGLGRRQPPIAAPAPASAPVAESISAEPHLPWPGDVDGLCLRQRTDVSRPALPDQLTNNGVDRYPTR